ncbi:cysteine hydrolase [Enterobacteriaceae bacterium YMB-R22]|uniref:cysteine hydrolase family protein n=1 Tax=Tenebrionicola larvae TaxID=2815733 RepID=UPI002012E727|nr:cysteine hydrolase [Tenebrionicola larvae]MBV4411940.1 cysteine hydrolase [Tenebrionicola larvae]
MRELHNWLRQERCALCIIDVQQDFVPPLSVPGEACEAVWSALENVSRLYQAARQADMCIFFIGLHTSPETDSPVWRKFMRRAGKDPGLTSRLCRAHTAGATFYPLSPSQTDTVIYKHKYSAFWGTDFKQQLINKGITALIICGLTTECCVDTTARDAFQLDYTVFIVSDGCASYRPDFHDAALNILSHHFAITCTTEQVVSFFHNSGRQKNKS